MMKKTRLIILPFLLIVGCVFAQNLPIHSEIEKMTPSEKILLYQNMQQDPIENMLRSYLFPTFGHYQINKWRRGAKIYVVGLLTSIGSGIVLEALLQQDESTGFIYAMIGGAITHIWQIVDAGKQTKIYNENLYRKIFRKEPSSISFKLQPKYGGDKLTMSYSFN